MAFPRLSWSSPIASQRSSLLISLTCLTTLLGACGNDLTSPSDSGADAVAFGAGGVPGASGSAQVQGARKLGPGGIALVPHIDTLAPGESLTFVVYGITTAGDSVGVRAKLQADGLDVNDLQVTAATEGTFMVRAVQQGGNGTDTAWVVVRGADAPTSPAPVDSQPAAPAPPDTTTAPAPPDTATAPAPAPAPDTTTVEPAPVPAPSFPALTGAVAELPRTFLDTRYVAPTGRTIAVPAGGDLQAAINGAARGDVIELAAGATYTGNFALKPKSGSGWITIRTATSLPPEGTRMTPSLAAGLAKIVTPNSMPALWTESSSATSHYRIVGVEFRSSASMTYNIVNLGDYMSTASSVSDLAQWIVLDRVYIHGSASQNIRRCLALNTRSTAVIDSWLSECHYEQTDSQGIAGWNGPGPFKIVNNHIEGASENIMFGGADPTFSYLVPSDIEIRRNHIFKPTSIRNAGWSVKNLFESKNAQRVLVEGNLFENNWAEAQTGFAIVIKSENQSGGCSWCVSQDFTFRHNVIKNSPGGFNIAAMQNYVGASIPANDIEIANNVFQDVAQSGMAGNKRLFQLIGALGRLRIIYNTGLSDDNTVMFDGPANPSVVIAYNLFDRAQYGIFGSGHGEGTSALAYYAPNGIFSGNVVISAPSDRYPTGNYYPGDATAAGLILDQGWYRLGSSSPYYGTAEGGRSPGANLQLLRDCMAGCSNGQL